MNKVIHIIDDDALHRELIKTILKGDYLFTESSNIQESIDFLSKNNPHLILLDLYLKEENGLKILKYLKENKKLTQTKVIVLSASRSSQDIKEAQALGADDYCLKPFEKLIFRKKITSTLNKNKIIQYKGHPMEAVANHVIKINSSTPAFSKINLDFKLPQSAFSITGPFSDFFNIKYVDTIPIESINEKYSYTMIYKNMDETSIKRIKGEDDYELK